MVSGRHPVQTDKIDPELSLFPFDDVEDRVLDTLPDELFEFEARNDSVFDENCADSFFPAVLSGSVLACF